MLDSLAPWSRVYTIIAICFVAVNTLLFVPWRKSFKTMTAITITSIFVLAGVSAYVCFFTQLSFSMTLLIVDVIWFALAFWLARYRDARTLFSLLSVWVFCLAGSVLSFVGCYSVENAAVRLIITIGVHAVFPVCIAVLMRKSYFRMMEFGKKGWFIGCIVLLLPFFLLRLVLMYPNTLSHNPDNIPMAALMSITCLVFYVLFAKMAEYLLLQRREKQSFDLIAAQINHTEQLLQEAARREKQSAVLRHDLRHFTNVISGCLQNKAYDDALAGVQSLLSHPAMHEAESRYCKNPTLNALLNSYAQTAKASDIDWDATVALGDSLCVDTMDLAVLLSNMLENAVNACRKQAQGLARSIRVKLYMAGDQLFISISNTCAAPVIINEETGLPAPEPHKEGHGVGMVSVRMFLQKYGAQADCLQEDGKLQIRIVACAPALEEKEEKEDRHVQSSVLRINVIISSLIIIGFLLAGFSSYVSFNRLFKTDIESVSELTSENIYANVKNLMDLPLNVSTAMAHDTLLQELMRREAKLGESEEMTRVIQAYLASYQEKYDFDSVALTSAKTGAYYHYQNGLARKMSRDNPEDAWYYEFLKEEIDSKLNIDNDKIKEYEVTLFADTKLRDTDGTVLGIIGIGMKTPYIQQLLESNERNHNVQTYLIDETGIIQLSSGLTKQAGVNLFDQPMFDAMESAIAQDKTEQVPRWYSDGKVDGYVITTYIPNLNWYLVVEKDTAELQRTMLHQFCMGLLFLAGVVSVVLFIINSILTRYYKVLAGRAQRDALTGLRNRSCCEQELRMFSGRLSDYAQFGIGLFSLTNFKRINSALGRQAGDAVLASFATLLGEAFVHCPLFRIGSDEFLAVFLNMEEEEVRKKWEILSMGLEQQSHECPVAYGASFGYAFRNDTELTTVDAIFKAAEHNTTQSGSETERSIK